MAMSIPEVKVIYGDDLADAFIDRYWLIKAIEWFDNGKQFKWMGAPESVDVQLTWYELSNLNITLYKAFEYEKMHPGLEWVGHRAGVRFSTRQQDANEAYNHFDHLLYDDDFREIIQTNLILNKTIIGALSNYGDYLRREYGDRLQSIGPIIYPEPITQPTEKPEELATDYQPIRWRGSPEQLKQLADQLQEQGYIKSSQWFVERFGSECPPDVNGWECAANLIVYLLERLQEEKLFVHVPQSRLEGVFRIKAYKSKKDGYGRNGAGKPTKADEIDRILSCVFPDS